MMTAIFNLHSYLILNVIIILSYFLTRFFFIFYRHLSQYHKLILARFCFLTTIFIFLLAPYVVKLYPLSSTAFEITPTLHQATQLLAHSQEKMAIQFSQVENLPRQISLKLILISLWLTGMVIFAYRYLSNLWLLKKLQQDAYCLHKLHHVHILFSPTLHTSCCWSLLHKQYIALPYFLLTKNEDRKITIRHELQHIRQGDTYWLHFLRVLQIICFWNPFLKYWIKWLSELQEFSCDEQIIIRKKTSPAIYAQCLVNAAKQLKNQNLFLRSVLSINGFSQSILLRRVNMLFTYKKHKRKMTLITACTISFLTISGVVLALNPTTFSTITTQEVKNIIQQSDISHAFHIDANSAVVAMINNIRHNEKNHEFMISSLERMKRYKSTIEQNLKKYSLPNDLLALPLVESGYKMLDEKLNPVHAAGIWQIIPSTASHFGLVINGKRDDRLNIQLSTQAALTYLKLLYEQFHDWKLAVLAYEIGEKETENLIHLTGSRDAWTIANSSYASEKYKSDLKHYLAMFDASVIIMHHPSLIKE